MGLKQLIRQQQILAQCADAEMVLPGEPLIYCIKWAVGRRVQGLNVFRDLQWCSMLKCHFPKYMYTKTPVVLLIRFYVSPPSKIQLSAKELKAEATPAAQSYEVCDYTLSFLEMLHKVLFNSYRQVVKLDVEKYYSSEPRTCFKFMKWSDYVNVQGAHPFNSQTKGKRKTGKVEFIQSERARNESASRNRKKSASTRGIKSASSFFGAATCDCEVFPALPGQPQGICKSEA